MALLEVKQLEVAYDEVQVLWGVSLVVEQGSITALIGSNGAGKSTTLRTIFGLKQPLRGQIVFDGRQIERLPSHQVAAVGVSLILEGGRPFPQMSVLENLDLGAKSAKARADMPATLEQVYDLFPVLRERRHQMAGTLSGGERQMLALGRAMMSQARLLMLDEPSLGLAPLVVEQMFGAIRTLNAQGMTILLVEQNIQHTLRLAGHSYVLETGRIAMEGAAELLDNEHVKTAYLGL